MRIPSFIAVLCITLASTAQDKPAFLQGHQGPRLGIGMATQSNGALFANGTDLLLAPLIGWHFEAPIHPQMSVMPEILWMTKGAVVRNPALSTRAKSTYRYLEVPVSLKISTDKGADGLYLLVGPSFGYYLSGRYEEWLYGDKITDQKYELSSTEKRFQFSALVGMGMEGERWAFDVRAQTSLTPFESLARVQNVVYALTVAYRIAGKKPAPQDPEE